MDIILSLTACKDDIECGDYCKRPDLALNFILFKILGPHISSIALALAIGYVAGAVYISKYYFKKDSTFRLVSPCSLSIKDWFYFRSHALVASPELVGRVCIVIKTTVMISLCATYLGDVGLLAFLVYDNVETLLYMVVSGMTKSVSPFLTLFYNERDYPSVEFITRLSVKQILIFIVSISAVFIIFPEILLFLFNMTVPSQQAFISLAIRITCLGLIGRGMCLIIESYAQAISSYRISALMNFLQEGILPFVFILIVFFVKVYTISFNQFS